ncbi:hypothetical protein [Rhodococcus sp. O3]|uniref:hypothetical protein n=1 Tax=Rhodococcus sp. O3 TaxID=3404919 RepID=UPI003B66D14E
MLLLTVVLPTPVEVQNPTWVIAIWSAAVLALVIALVGYVRGASALPFASRRAYSRMRARLHLLGRVYPARSSTGTEAFRIDAGGVWQDTSVVIDTALAADDAARLLRAFDLWFTVLENDALACRAAQLRFGSATIVTSEEIFGPGAVGGYLVLDQYSGTIGWRLLVAGRPLNPLVGPYRGGEIFAVADPRAPEEPQSCSISHADDSGHLLERVATAVALSAAVGGMLWFGWVITSGPW